MPIKPLRRCFRATLPLAAFVAGLATARPAWSEASVGGPTTLPVAVRQEEPLYPFSMRMSGTKGEVVVDFVVDPDGNVIEPNVTRSSHPDFEAPAIEAILKWRFKPGTRDGRAVYSHMQETMTFQLTGVRGGSAGGDDAWAIAKKAPRELPEMYQYDEPPKPRLMGAPVYPFELLAQKVRGNATVGFAIDPSGRTCAVTLESATSPEFGRATVAMVEAWSFDPARKGGKPSWCLMKREQVFGEDLGDFPMDYSAIRILKELKRNPSPVLTNSSSLDAPLRGRFRPGPAVPASVAKAGLPAKAQIEFIVDHAGHAQLPRIVSSTNAEFAWAAATAVSRWQFNPPTKNRKSVDVLVAVPIEYDPPAQPQPPKP